MLYKFVSEITSYVKLGTRFNCNFYFLKKKKNQHHTTGIIAARVWISINCQMILVQMFLMMAK